MDKTPPAPLTEEIAAFTQRGVSVVAASRDVNFQPSLARAYACHISPDRCHVTIVLRASQAAALLADIAACGQIALTITEPSTHRTYQLKGTDARIQPLRPFDHAGCDTHTAAFLSEVRPMGYDDALILAVMDSPPEDRVAVSFTPVQAFNQTPGAAAGARLT